MQSTKQEKYSEPGHQSFLSSTIQELDSIANSLESNGDRLDKISTRAGARCYEDLTKSGSDVKKSPETVKEIMGDLISIIRSKIYNIEDRIRELDEFI